MKRLFALPVVPLLGVLLAALLPLALTQCSSSPALSPPPRDAAATETGREASTLVEDAGGDTSASVPEAGADTGATEDGAIEDAAPDAPDDADDAADAGPPPCSLRFSGTSAALLDPTFAQPEITSVLPSGFYANIYSAVGPAGDVYIGFLGSEPSTLAQPPVIVHVTAAGTLDTGFGSGGAMIIPWEVIYSVSTDAEDNVFVTGDPGATSAMLVAGFHPDGELFLSAQVVQPPGGAGGAAVQVPGGYLAFTAQGVAFINAAGHVSYPDGGVFGDNDFGCELVRANAWVYLGCQSGFARYALDGTFALAYVFPEDWDLSELAVEIPASDSTLYAVPNDTDELVHFLTDGTVDPAFGTVTPSVEPSAGWQRCDGNLLLAEYVASAAVGFERVPPAGTAMPGDAGWVTSAGSFAIPTIPDAGAPFINKVLGMGPDGAVLLLVAGGNDGERTWIYRVLPSL